MDRSDQPLSGASPTEVDRFADGDALFEASFRVPDGLGPLYVRASCEGCHQADGRGPGLVAKMAMVGAMLGSDRSTPRPDQLPLRFGNTQRPFVAAGARTPIATPVGSTGLRVTYRLPPAVWGRGYLEAVDDQEIERVAAAAAARPGPIKGRIHRVRYGAEPNPGTRVHAHALGTAGLIGRFGLKARIATLDEFAADALQSDMGLTSPLRPNELPNPDGLADDAKPGVDVSLETLNALADYVRLIEMPRRPNDGTQGRGPTLFAETLCATCHVPRLRTRADYPIAALAGIEAPVYTDLLLHDMGSALADGIVDGDAGPRDWRTAPLVGLRFMVAYLHDGRAHSVAEAIALHEGPGSEANVAVTRFRALGPSDQAQLVDFVKGL